MKKTYLAVCFNLSGYTLDDAVWIPMIPAGEVKGRDGRMWRNDHPDAVVAAFDGKLPFDIEHATEIKGPKGEDAGAVGWILALENRDGEIWAQIEWNQSGRWQIEDKRYCFYSPAFHYDEDRVITSMSSAGLTNKPNFYVPALNREEENTMPLPKAIAVALGLAEDATEEQGVTAINSLKSEKEVALNRANQPDLNKFVPKATYDIAVNRANEAENRLTEIHEQEIEALVDDAILVQHKVAPKDKDMYISLCRTEEGREQFKSFVESAPEVVSSQETKKPSATATNSQLEDHELALCRKMGVSSEEFLTAKAEMNKEEK